MPFSVSKAKAQVPSGDSLCGWHPGSKIRESMECSRHAFTESDPVSLRYLPHPASLSQGSPTASQPVTGASHSWLHAAKSLCSLPSVNPATHKSSVTTGLGEGNTMRSQDTRQTLAWKCSEVRQPITNQPVQIQGPAGLGVAQGQMHA